MSASVDNPHSSLAKAMPITDISEEDSKKSKPAQVRYLGAPPGLHYLPILAMFVFIMMMVFEKDEKSRQILFLPVLFSFLIYKFLFLVEENTAIDSFLRKRR
jgi:1,4-dihydroxy-2-naphthoate octaprenyltransferase